MAAKGAVRHRDAAARTGLRGEALIHDATGRSATWGAKSETGAARIVTSWGIS
jgi:hypothetical protein